MLFSSWSSIFIFEIIDVVNGVIQANTFWQYPSLECNPANGVFSVNMNAADPQYVITDKKPIRDMVKSRFNEFYAERRLRFYNSVDSIPDNSVGFASCVNLFEYLPLDPIKYMCHKVFSKLKPGGKFLITYNDCEQRYSLELLDNNLRCLCTKNLLSSVMLGLGYDINVADNQNDGVWSYMLLEKPGKLSSKKLAGPDAEFIPKIVPFDAWPKELQSYVKERQHKNAGQWKTNINSEFRKEWRNLHSSVLAYIYKSGF